MQARLERKGVQIPVSSGDALPNRIAAHHGSAVREAAVKRTRRQRRREAKISRILDPEAPTAEKDCEDAGAGSTDNREDSVRGVQSEVCRSPSRVEKLHRTGPPPPRGVQVAISSGVASPSCTAARGSVQHKNQQQKPHGTGEAQVGGTVNILKVHSPSLSKLWAKR